MLDPAVTAYLREVIAPQANLMDTDPLRLKMALAGLAERGWLGLRIPAAFGGMDVSTTDYQQFQSAIARYSGALAFLQTQHQSAASFLAQSPNTALQAQYLPAMAQGALQMGVGYSQLRRQGAIPTKATPVAGGYQLHGTVPWVTGQGCFQTFVVAATLPNDEAVFGVVPLTSTQQAGGGELLVGEPMALAAMAATQTVAVELQNWFLSEDQVIDIKPAGWIHATDQRKVLGATWLALGCAHAGLDIVAKAAQVKGFDGMTQTLKALEAELEDCKRAIQQTESAEFPEKPFPEKVKLRAWAIALAHRCAQAAVVVSSGAANAAGHDAQRVYREALVFTVSGQTPAIMAATLKTLTRSHQSPHA